LQNAGGSEFKFFGCKVGASEGEVGDVIIIVFDVDAKFIFGAFWGLMIVLKKGGISSSFKQAS